MPGEPAKTKIKTFRCDYTNSDGTRVYVYVPEELNVLTAGKTYSITLTTRVDSNGEGLVAVAPSNIYWTVI